MLHKENHLIKTLTELEQFTNNFKYFKTVTVLSRKNTILVEHLGHLFFVDGAAYSSQRQSVTSQDFSDVKTSFLRRRNNCTIQFRYSSDSGHV